MRRSSPVSPSGSKLEKLVTDPRFSSLVNVSMEMDLSDSDTLTPECCTQVLAIVQETFSNIVRHAKARHVLVAAHHPDDRLQIMVKDDGIGIPAHIVEGNGLRNMRDRAALLHGELVVERLAKGTRVSLDIPCKAEA